MPLGIALQFIRQICQPEGINSLQESLFSQCWLGYTYQQTAEHLGYDPIYMRRVGAQLWNLLSDKLQERVTKNNFHSVIQKHAVLQTQLQAQLEAQLEAQLQTQSSLPSPPVPTAVISVNTLQRLESNPGFNPGFNPDLAESRKEPQNLDQEQLDYYIERPPIESQCHEAMIQGETFIRIRAPKQMGKTALVTRLLREASHYPLHTVILSLQLADADIFTDLGRFLKWFCAAVAHQLGFCTNVDAVWDDLFGNSYNCTNYLEQVLLPKLEFPLVLALDDVDILFEYPEISTSFLGLLRAWYEKAKHQGRSSSDWRKLKLIVVHSTEVYIPLHHNQSPFNIGLSIDLPEFTPQQVQSLAYHYGLSWTIQEASLLRDLVGGQPQLLRLSLEKISQTGMSLAMVIDTAIAPNSIYQAHLKRQFRQLQQYPDLMPVFHGIVASETPVAIEAIQGFRLEGFGLVHLWGNQASPSCDLYRHYFRALFGEPL